MHQKEGTIREGEEKEKEKDHVDDEDDHDDKRLKADTTCTWGRKYVNVIWISTLLFNKTTAKPSFKGAG